MPGAKLPAMSHVVARTGLCRQFRVGIAGQGKLSRHQGVYSRTRRLAPSRLDAVVGS